MKEAKKSKLCLAAKPHQKSKPVAPPFVTYRLSVPGKRLRPIIDAMANWAFQDMKAAARLKSKQAT
ncbi:winged helix-turn-helix transcriptional regulator [Chitinophaga parva]|uniref:winged helix-turn-helix transcriptional regulator n=1 Tax=Chitinophaga parva TaxID=2169414 RepID=UPI00196B0AA1